MNEDDIDRILADEEQVRPSSRLLTSVMQAVEREAAAARCPTFPWIRAVPGLIAGITLVAEAIRHGLGLFGDPAAVAALSEEVLYLTALAAYFGLQWVLLAVAITIVSVLLPIKLMRVRIGA